jgi:hypothetical protein
MYHVCMLEEKTLDSLKGELPTILKKVADETNEK